MDSGVGSAKGFISTLSAGDYERQPVPIRQFIEDEEYLGKFTDLYHENWRKFLDDAMDLDSLVTTLIFTGAIGIGKDTTAAIATLYKIYCLSCLRDPARFYGLMSGSRIVFGVFNITIQKAETCFEQMLEWTDRSPYFKKNLQRLPRTSVIHFPAKNIRVETGSLMEHALGENMFGFILNEANFFKKDKSGGDKDTISKAVGLYGEARTRLISRFSHPGGRVPGLMILISSRKHTTSFLEKQIEEAQRVPEVAKITRIAQFALWDVKPKGTFADKKFQVVLGDHKHPPRVLEEDEIPPKGFMVVDVPDDSRFRTEFARNCDKALRDLAGVATYGVGKFFPPAHVHDSTVTSYNHPFTVDEVHNLGLGMGTKLSELFKKEAVTRIIDSKVMPRLNRLAARYVHIDIGLTKDALGLAVGHMGKLDGVEGVILDLVLRVKAPTGSEVDLDEIISFMRFLRECGYRLGSITYDGYQSRHSIQILKKAGFRADTRSISLSDYDLFRRLLVDGQLGYYYYATLVRELLDLNSNEDKRPSHPEPDGTDDVCDAVAGVVGAILDKHPSVSGSSGRTQLLPPVI